MTARSNIDGTDMIYENDKWIEDMNPEKLLMELYKYRQPSEHDQDNNILNPFIDVPYDLMHRIDGFFLTHT